MRQRLAGTLASAGVVAAAGLALASGASAATQATTQLPGTTAPAATSTPSAGAVPASTAIDFAVNLALPDQSGAATFAQAVSTPGSASYRQFLTPAQWETRFSPSAASVRQVKQYLTSQGFTVSGVTPDRLVINASGSVAQIQSAFDTSLSYHTVAGDQLILNSSNLTVPNTIASLVSGISGVSQTVATPDNTTGASSTTGSTGTATAGGVATSPSSGGATTAVKPPAGFRNAGPCATYYGQITATDFPAVPGGYPADPAYAPCGYTPPQMRSAYGLTGADNGAGTTVAIVDAYASPTLFADAHEYSTINDPSNVLTHSQFSELLAPSFNDGAACQGQSGWWGEQTLDVEAVHATAPGAHILFAGAQNCEGGLNAMIQKIVDGHKASIITNSYGDTGGDLLDTASDRAATDTLLQMAAGTGVSVLFSSGDDGDNFIATGQVTPDYPASSPWATAVGGTSLGIGSSGQRLGEYGWSTGRAVYCNQAYVNAGGCSQSQLGTWSPMTYDYGGGGGTSYSYYQPSYQAGVVPTSISEVRSATPMRTIPDISMDADPTTGLLIGETQTFPNGTYYDQYRLGGTSLASPLMAGVLADADQSAGGSLGFVNPALYALSGNANAIDDITAPGSPLDILRPDYIDGVDAAQGIYYSARAVNYQNGTETCAPPSCKKTVTHATTLTTAPGYDNMTGLGSPGPGFVAALAAEK